MGDREVNSQAGRAAGQQEAALRALPAVGEVLGDPRVGALLARRPRVLVRRAVREVLEAVRSAIRSGARASAPPMEEIVALVSERLGGPMRGLRPVVNATGIVLHTGLGRAPLAESVCRAVAELAGGYCNLEFDLSSGRRGRRAALVEPLLCELTGAEAATVVNNNAAATLLVLHALAAEREVIVSRGQLIEIGGSFRLPEVMLRSGAFLREVGTTNRTRLADYEAAINEHTAMLLHVHTSNYRIVGFTESVPTAALVALARRKGLIVYDDLGSGTLVDLAAAGVGEEPTVPASVEAGADVVSFSGDKLLGGPQCGIVVGRRDLIERIERDPLMRTMRVDRLRLAALQATLEIYAAEGEVFERIPVLRDLTVGQAALARRAEGLRKALERIPAAGEVEVGEDVSFAGGGALPGCELPTRVVRWRPEGFGADEAARRLRLAEPAVVARVRDEWVLFDMRTVGEDEIDAVAEAVSQVVRGGGAA